MAHLASEDAAERPPRSRAKRRPPDVPAVLGEGRYQILRLFRESVRKRVFLARDLRLGREVAVAIVESEGLDEARLLRLTNEVRRMAQIGDHPNLVTMYDVGEVSEGVPFFVTPCFGRTLADLLAGCPARRLSIERALAIGEDVARGLAHVHSRGVRHGNLRTEDVWLTDDGVAKLGDVGLSGATETEAAASGGAVRRVGTAPHGSPERLRDGVLDARDDLRSLGAMLREMLVGRPALADGPLAGPSEPADDRTVPHSLIDGIPPELGRLVTELLAGTAERSACAADVASSLRTIRLGVAPAAATDAARGHPLDRIAGGAFLGRSAEMARLRAALDSSTSDRLRVALVVGEPGIGKTRTAEELAAEARDRGAEVVWGRCHERDGAPAYWPWIQLLRSLVQDREPGLLAEQLGSGAAVVAELLPEIREVLPRLESPPALDPEHARFRLFDAITHFFRRAAQSRPLVLVLDDLHWADAPSLLLLQFLARQASDARILVVAGYRDLALPRTHPLARTLGELAPVADRIELSGLSRPEVRDSIARTTGVTPPEGLVDAVFERSEGNPLFLTELVRILANDARLDRNDEPRAWAPRIPGGVREAVGRRLSQLSPACDELLGIASVVGRLFELAIVERVARLERSRVLDLVEEAHAARLVHEQADARGTYAFSHALVREALYEELPATRRAALHGEVAAAIEEIDPTRLEARASALARHHLEAALGGGDERRAIDAAIRAGRCARRVLAYEEAVRHYESAAEIARRCGSEPRLRSDVALALGDAQLCIGERSAALTAFSEAAAIARELGDADLLGEAALGVARSTVSLGRESPASLDLLDEALRAVGPGDGRLRVRLLACTATALSRSSEDARRTELTRSAVAMARRIGDPATLATALCAAQFGRGEPGQGRKRLESAREIVALAERVGDAETSLQGRVWTIAALLELADVVAADVEIDSCERAATALRQARYRAFATAWRVTRALLAGEFDRAERWLQTGMELAGEAAEPTALMSLAVQDLLLRSERGRLAEVETALAGLRSQAPEMPAWRIGLANLYAHLGRLAEARSLFEEVAAEDFRDLPHDLTWKASAVLLADVAALLPDLPRAAILYEQLLPFADEHVVLSTSVCLGSPHHHLGLLATSLARWDVAASHFEEAVAAHRRIGARPRWAHSERAYAEMLLLRGRPEDRAAAEARIETADVIAKDLGMELLADALTRLRERIATDRPSASSPWREVGSIPREADAVRDDGAPADRDGARRGDDPCAFRREGEYWTLVYGGRLVRLKETRGFHYIARLLREPGTEIPCSELAGDGLAVPSRPGTDSLRAPEAGLAVATSLGDAGEALDARAKAQYRSRLVELRAELDEAEAFHDAGRAERAREEIEQLDEQLRAAVGLGGRDRRSRSHAERLRVRIAQAIRVALRKIERGHPDLGRHLATSIHTGHRCAYRPQPAVELSWEL